MFAVVFAFYHFHEWQRSAAVGVYQACISQRPRFLACFRALMRDAGLSTGPKKFS